MNHRTELVDVIRRVRNHWRMRLALRGAVVVVAGTALALLLSASGLQSFRFSAPAIITFRIVSVAVFVGLLLYALVWPLRRRVTDAQVAMYLEECDPTLEAAIISAVEATADGGSPAHSPRLVEKLVEQAIERCDAIDQGRSADRTAAQRHAATLGVIAALVALILTFGPAYLRHGLSALLVISRSAEASSPYSIEVQPGSAKVPDVYAVSGQFDRIVVLRFKFGADWGVSCARGAICTTSAEPSPGDSCTTHSRSRARSSPMVSVSMAIAPV